MLEMIRNRAGVSLQMAAAGVEALLNGFEKEMMVKAVATKVKPYAISMFLERHVDVINMANV